MSGAHTSLTLSNLAPETTYEVALIPESNIHYFPPQTTRVTTLAGKTCAVMAKGEVSTVLSLTNTKQTGQPLVCIPWPRGLTGGGRRLWSGQNIMSCFMYPAASSFLREMFWTVQNRRSGLMVVRCPSNLKKSMNLEESRARCPRRRQQELQPANI